jgi:hypothetical protein
MRSVSVINFHYSTEAQPRNDPFSLARSYYYIAHFVFLLSIKHQFLLWAAQINAKAFEEEASIPSTLRNGKGCLAKVTHFNLNAVVHRLQQFLAVKGAQGRLVEPNAVGHSNPVELKNHLL